MNKAYVEFRDEGYWIAGTRVSLDSIVYYSVTDLVLRYNPAPTPPAPTAHHFSQADQYSDNER